MSDLQKDFIKKLVASKLGLGEENPKVSALAILVEEVLNEIMKEERSLYLEEREEDKENGYYERYLATPIGKILLSVPRTRKGEFRPGVLPPLYSRTETSYANLLQALVENGYLRISF